MTRELRSLVLSLLVALLLGACSAMEAPTPSPMAPEASTAPEATPTPQDGLAEPLPFDPTVRRGLLDNGLRYYLRAHDEPHERAELRLVVAAGSVLETEAQRGLAHFLEHMAFNGTEHFEKQELVDYLESTGMRFGPDINAYTSFDETVYMLTVPTDQPELLERGFLILSDWASRITLDPEEVDKERGVVLEERRLGRGAEARMWDRQYPILLAGSRYAERLPIGLPEVLENAPAEEIARFYRSWYRPGLMAVVAVGDFDPDRVEALVRQYFDPLANRPEAPERPRIEVPAQKAPLFDVATDPEATQTRVEVYYKRPARSEATRGDYRRSLVESLYHGMLNDRLREIARRPEPPFLFAFSSSGSFVRPIEALYQIAGVPDGEVETGLDALLAEVERVARHGFTATELERARADLLRQIDQAFLERDKIESSSFASEYVRNFLQDEPAPGIEVERDLFHQLLPGIGLDEVNAIATEWVENASQVVLVRAPETTADRLPDAEHLAAIFEEVQGRTLAPWEDRTRDEPLLAELPEPGPVVAENRIEELGVVEWTLANGVRVVLKPTDFKNDEILLRAFSPGGDSLVPVEDVPSASFATAIAAEGGLGDFDRIELEKALAGKIAQAGVAIGELSEGASGSASPEDLETMLQLLYLRFTAPRRDEAAYASLMTRIGAWIQHRLDDPEAVFSDRWQVVASQGNPRRRPISPEVLAEVDLDRALAIYRDRFADAGDFTFVLVGNLDLETLRPLVERYLGGLPTTGREESWGDPGVEPPPGAVRFEVHKGIEPKSRVQFLLHGDAEFSLAELHLAQSLGQALQIRLREVLREDMGATYGVGVSTSLDYRPEQEYESWIGFGCAPDRVEASLEALEHELAVFREQGPDAETVAKVQEIQHRERETNLRENRFWLGVLTSYYERGDDPRGILEYERLVDGLDTERLRDAARRYLDPESSILGVLYPSEEGASAGGS